MKIDDENPRAGEICMLCTRELEMGAVTVYEGYAVTNTPWERRS